MSLRAGAFDSADEKVTGLRAKLRGRTSFGALLLGLGLIQGLAQGASAETLESALARAYSGNPTLGAQRASVRATDENVPRARSLGRPIVSATADIGAAYTETRNDFGSSSASGCR